MRNFEEIRGEKSSFNEIYSKYKDYFICIAVSYVRNKAVAEDLVTDTFVKVWENRTQFMPDNIPAYMLTVLKNKCLDWLRDEATHLRLQKDIHDKSSRILQERIACLEDNDPKNLMLCEAIAIIERELEQMPERRRRIFLAHRNEDMSYHEIAAIYHLSEGQINYEIRTAKETLRIALKDYLPIIGIFLGI